MSIFPDDKTETQEDEPINTQGHARRRALRRPRCPQDACSCLGLEGLGPALTSPRKAAHSTTVVNQRSTLWARPFGSGATASGPFSAPGLAERSRCPPAPPDSSSNSSVAAPPAVLRAPRTGHRASGVQDGVRPRPRVPRGANSNSAGTSPRERDPGSEAFSLRRRGALTVVERLPGSRSGNKAARQSGVLFKPEVDVVALGTGLSDPGEESRLGEPGEFQTLKEL